MEDCGWRRQFDAVVKLHSSYALSVCMSLLYLCFKSVEPIILNGPCAAGRATVHHLYLFLIFSLCCYLFYLLGWVYLKYAVMSCQLRHTGTIVSEIIAMFGFGFLIIAVSYILQIKLGRAGCSRDTDMILKVMFGVLTPVWLLFVVCLFYLFFCPNRHDHLPPKQPPCSPSASNV